jgi:phage terminase large subunit
MKTTRIFNENTLAFFDKTKRRALNEGGTSSTKTFSILQLLVFLAEYAKEQTLISVVSESMPHLKRGCIRDFLVILGDRYQDELWNKSEALYEFPNNLGKIEFFSADQASKLRGGRRDILFINECNNIPYEAYMELDIRTRLFTFLDWNPVGEFWAHDKNLIHDAGTQYIHSTYLDGVDVLPASVVANIEAQKDKDPNWWNVYGLGKLGNVTGIVHPFFIQEDALPEHEQQKEFYGLDFGFTNDPTSLIRNIITGGDELHSEQLIYETGLDNNQIAKRMEQLGVDKSAVVWGDSAEPKSISEISKYGFNINPAPKGKDSITNGIQLVNQHRQFWTKNSVDCIKEQRNYRYEVTKDGKLTNIPRDLFNHSMDARRYAVMGEKLKAGIQVF